MRLKQIKLSGFKSFVDPTLLDVPGQLIGVVGPNGCGKSNIMDAVRWVLGESRANELRGESMQDVIFSGSADRKPSARASVELVFDNAMGRIGGSWGVFAEVSVKRILTRDGQSIYSINQQTVRRRDVHDLFSGTGLGPRAYAIIGQGTISRIIESKPEELRIFLEEAAGISRYKERRKETEHRLADTRDNLTRVEDILSELETQVLRLEAQAEQAARFQSLDEERAHVQGLLWLARKQDALAQRHRAEESYRAFELRLEEQLAELRAIESRLESARKDAGGASDSLHTAQADYYQAHTDVARLESEIRLTEESKRQALNQLQSLNDEHQRHRLEQEHIEQTIRDATQRLDALGVSVQDQSDRVQQLSSHQQIYDDHVLKAQETLENSRSTLESLRRSCDALKIRQQTMQEQQSLLQQRLQGNKRMRQALKPVSAEALENEETRLAEAIRLELESGAAESSLEIKSREAAAAKAPGQEELRKAQQRHTELEARLQALQQLEARLSDQSKMRPWLQSQGLLELRRFWQGIRVEAGWDAAIESALREKLEAITLNSVTPLTAISETPPPNKQVFILKQPSATQALENIKPRGRTEHSVNQPAGVRQLRELVQCGDEAQAALLDQWLRHDYAADSLALALACQSNLSAGQRVFTPLGHCVERETLSFHAADQSHEGRLARQREAEDLQKALRAQDLLVEHASQQAQHAERIAQELSLQWSQARQHHLLATRTVSQVKLDTERIRQLLAQTQTEAGRLEKEWQALEQELHVLRQQASQASEQITKHEVELTEAQSQFARAQQEHAAAQQGLSQWREGMREAERQLDAYRYEYHSYSERLENAKRRGTALEHLLANNAQQRVEVEQRIAAYADDSLKERLQRALAMRVQTESILAQCREQHEQINRQVRELEEQRMLAERAIEPLRESLSAAALETQAAKTSAEQFEQMLMDAKVNEQALLQLAATQHIALKATTLQSSLLSITQAIERLGPVNLAALDELKHARERQSFLRSQSADLSDAMQTLEDAIRKIDHETRDLLRQTYDQVNLNFGSFFPKLFGGGDAKLLLTGEEILDAGIQVMAHPPGKRNSSIHLLSGGEKALTAIALVFSIFQLNPAPFCLLDEVDAPLDDANTERYCDMVRSMSGQTQFLFITHNKLAMELAQQLVGVTMQERGVSRLVAVDLEAAAQLAQAA